MYTVIRNNLPCTRTHACVTLIVEVIDMAVSKAHGRASNKYNQKAYDHIHLMVKKGRKAKIESRGKDLGLSVNGYINHLIDKDLPDDETTD